MPASDLEVVNGALTRLGHPPISSLTEGSVAARLYATTFATIRRRALGMHPWNFATRRVALTETTAPDENTGFSRAFTLPADYLRVVEVMDAGADEWTVEGRELLTNVDGTSDGAVWVKYTRDVDQPGLYSPAFVEQMVHLLAEEWAEVLTGSITVAQRADARLERRGAQARSADSQEGSNQRPRMQGGWVEER